MQNDVSKVKRAKEKQKDMSKEKIAVKRTKR